MMCRACAPGPMQVNEMFQDLAVLISDQVRPRVCVRVPCTPWRSMLAALL